MAIEVIIYCDMTYAHVASTLIMGIDSSVVSGRIDGMMDKE